jgi:hypothetical protein
MYFTAQEGASILSQTDDSTSFVATGFNATRSTIENARLGDYRLLHFATHTFIDDVYPELSRIELTAVDPDGRYRDPYLYSFDLPHLDLPRDLIVLSSCETGIGKGVDGEGLISLTYSLMAGGTKRIVASLWAVNGESTAVLMERFYRGLLADRLSPAEALRQAQISMWKDERWTSPSNWGAFVFAGDWQGWTLDTEELRRSELNGTVLASVLEDSKSAGTYEILPRDVAPDAELYSFLDGPKPISDYVFSRLSQPALHLIGERDREKFRASLAQELNRILADDNVYSDDRFKGVALSEQARQLIATKPQGSEIVELNRMLMEEAFPSIISRRIIPRNDVMPGPPAPKYSWYGETTCLEEVDSSRSDIQTKLRDLETHPLYDCGSQIGLLKDLQGRCRYVRALDFRAKSFNSEVEATPASWGKLLANDKVSEMWIEDSVRVDADGNPIAQPDDWTRPVAVLSDKALYLVREQEDDSRERLVGAGGIKLREKRFSLGDAKDPRSTVSKVMNVFVADFQATFSSPPFNGNIANDPFLDKGELEMRSIDRPSLILGEPFIEDAAYVVNWWASDGEFVTFYTYGCTKGQKSCTGHDIYVDIDWSLLIRSSNTQPYRPPTPTQMAKYKEQIDKSLVLAVSKACQELNGKITDGVCKVP